MKKILSRFPSRRYLRRYIISLSCGSIAALFVSSAVSLHHRQRINDLNQQLQQKDSVLQVYKDSVFVLGDYINIVTDE